MSNAAEKHRHNESRTGSGRSRLAEITEVLRKNRIHRGVDPKKLRNILEELGPTYIKLGQIMSLHSDILPKEYCDELMKLNSNVIPMSFEAVEEILEESYGTPWRDIFGSIERIPLGSASIAQVHKAVLLSGEEVIIKVQRKGIYDIMSRDIALMKRAVKLMPPIGDIKNLLEPEMVLDELWFTAREEMDFLKEASNMAEFSANNRDIRYVSCPRLYPEYSTEKVLVMEYIDGFAINDAESLKENGYDLNEIGQKYVNNFIKQVMEDGFFHADPHPGNVRIRDGKIVWIDMGMMGRLTEKDRRIMVKGVNGIAKKDVTAIVNAVFEFGSYKGKPDRGKLYKDIKGFLDEYGGMSMGDLNVGEVMLDLLDIMKRNRIALPHGVSMLGRGLSHVEGVLAEISPDINMLEIAVARQTESALENFDWKKELHKSGRKLYRSAVKGVEIPELTADLLKEVLEGRAVTNIELRSDEDFKELTFTAVRNLVIGICEAALLMSSSMICMTDMKPKILGIPALGFFGYMGALGIAAFFSLRHIIRKRKKES